MWRANAPSFAASVRRHGVDRATRRVLSHANSVTSGIVTSWPVVRLRTIRSLPGRLASSLAAPLASRRGLPPVPDRPAPAASPPRQAVAPAPCRPPPPPARSAAAATAATRRRARHRAAPPARPFCSATHVDDSVGNRKLAICSTVVTCPPGSDMMPTELRLVARAARCTGRRRRAGGRRFRAARARSRPSSAFGGAIVKITNLPSGVNCGAVPRGCLNSWPDLTIPHDELAVLGLRRQRVREPLAVVRQPRAADRSSRIRTRRRSAAAWRAPCAPTGQVDHANVATATTASATRRALMTDSHGDTSAKLENDVNCERVNW